MNPALKLSIARIGMTVGVVGFITGNLILCYCPGWFVVSGIFLIPSILYGTNVMRAGATGLLVGCLLLGVLHYQKKQELAKRQLERRMKWQKK